MVFKNKRSKICVFPRLLISTNYQGCLSGSTHASTLLLFKENKASYWPTTHSPSFASLLTAMPSASTSLIKLPVNPLTIGSVAANSKRLTATTLLGTVFSIILGIVGLGYVLGSLGLPPGAAKERGQLITLDLLPSESFILINVGLKKSNLSESSFEPPAYEPRRS